MLKIGDFSRLSRISVRMLRHYDEIGLLPPVHIDPDTLYRYYDERQLITAARIAALRDMGFGLSEIGELLPGYGDRSTDSDRTRTGRQRKVLKAIMNKAKTMNTSEKMNFLDTVLPYITTNLNKTEIVKKISELDTYLSWPLEQYIVPQKATQYEMRDGLEVIIVDWEETTKYIHSVIYDGTEAKTSKT